MIRGNELIEVKADRFAIGVSVTGKISKFKNNKISYEEGDTFYIFSDGFADQFGGDTGEEKFKYSRFRKLLLEIKEKPLVEQKEIISDTFKNWKRDVAQMDDILVIGFKL